MTAPVHVEYAAPTERVTADTDQALVVLPDGDDSHRLYFFARDPVTVARMCSVVLAFVMENGLWPYVEDVLDQNPEPGRFRVPPKDAKGEPEREERGT